MVNATIEQPTEPQTEVNQEELEKAFSDSYRTESGQPLTETPAETPPPVTEPKVETEPPKTEAPTEPVTPEPEFVQLTKADYDDLLKLKGKMGKLDEGFGTLGNLKQLIDQMRTTDGKAVEVTFEDLKEIMDDAEGFPILGKQLVPVLNRILSRVKAGAASVDTDAIISQAETRLSERQRNEAHEDLVLDHPDYRTVVWEDQDGKVTFDQLDTKFTRWLKTQPESDQRRVHSNNPAYLSRLLSRFKEAGTVPAAPTPPATPPPKPNERAQRLAAAVAPRGVTPAGSPPEDDGFSSGFKSEFKQMGLT